MMLRPFTFRRRSSAVASLWLIFLVAFASIRAEARERFQVLTRSYDNQRTGANLSEKHLKPSNVNPSHFGKLFMLPVDDQIFAGLLYAADIRIAGHKRNVIYAATVNNSVYAFDADKYGPPLWYRNFNGSGRPTRNTEVGQACRNYNDFIGNIGIIGTPVIGPDGTMYFVTRAVEGNVTVQRLHAVDISTGEERPNSPQVVQAAVPGSGDGSNGSTVPFDPVTENQRAALSFSDGTVYVAWASFCDTRPYHGWMMSYDASTLAPMGVFNSSPNGNMAGVWMSGAGPAFDKNGNVYFATGNGTSDGKTGFGESMVKIEAKSLRVLDFFTPSNFNTLNEFDLDFGSQGPTMLPDTNLFVVGGKESKLYLLDANNLGGQSPGDIQVPQVVQAVDTTLRPTLSHHMHNAIPIWKGKEGLNAYVWGESDFLRSYRFDPATQKFKVPAAVTGMILAPPGMPGGMMTVSSNGSHSGTGILWATLPRAGDANQSIVPGVLYALDAESLSMLWSSAAPGDDPLNFAKGSPPIVANGKVYVASISNLVSVYGSRKRVSDFNNLALHARATGSTPCDPTQSADKAFNGSAEGGPSDKWCSSAQDAFLQVDLGRTVTIGRFLLEHAGSGGDDFNLNTSAFNIQVSTDGQNFQTVANVAGNVDSITTHDIPPSSARYVRLNIQKPARIDAPANIYEFQVFAPSQTSSPQARTPGAQAAAPAAHPGVVGPQGKVQEPSTGPKTEVTRAGRVITPPPDVAAPPIDAQKTSSGLAMKVLTPGTGTDHPVANDCVTLSFTSWKTDGTLFSTSTAMNDADVLCLTTAVMGVAEALKDMVVGEKRRLWIPEELTFHEGHHHAQRRPEDEEPPHKDLTFDITLLSIMKAPPTPADLKGPPADAVRTSSGLAYRVLQNGTGNAHPSMKDKVRVHFSGWRSDGKLFESTEIAKHPALVALGAAMAGWREAVSSMVVGEKARFWIPASLAFGEKPGNRFTPAGDMVYEIELLGVE